MAKAAVELLGATQNRVVRPPLIAASDDEAAEVKAGVEAALGRYAAIGGTGQYGLVASH
jgi:dihydrodipicolinate synthase/N-acetylneuraminate lyase